MSEDKIWKQSSEELLAVYLAILFIVGAYAYAGILFMSMPAVAVTSSTILVVLFGYLTLTDTNAKTDRRIMLPVSGIGALLFIALIINNLFVQVNPYLHTIIMLAYGIPFLAAMFTQILYLHLARGSNIN